MPEDFTNNFVQVPYMSSSCGSSDIEEIATELNMSKNNADDNDKRPLVRSNSSVTNSKKMFKEGNNNISSVDLSNTNYMDVDGTRTVSSLNALTIKSNKMALSCDTLCSSYRNSIFSIDGGGSSFLQSEIPVSFKQYKDLYFRAGINIFNRDFEKGIAYFIIFEYIEPHVDGVAAFLKTTKFLSKGVIGELLGSVSDDFCVKVLDAFSSLFFFEGVSVDVSLRQFQSIFRMPGESQKIQRILESFAEGYVKANKDNSELEKHGLLSSDAILVLTYAMMMLNTDLHNHSVKRKMSEQQFIKNVKGAESCSQLPEEYLAKIYQNIQAEEFELFADHSQQLTQMTSLIGGKHKPELLKHYRSFISFHGVKDVKNSRILGSSEKWLFIFNDCIIVTKLANRNPKSRTISKKYYSYETKIDLDKVIPYLTTKDGCHFVALYTLEKEIVCLYDCLNVNTQNKVFNDLQIFSREAYLTSMMLKNMPKSCYKEVIQNLDNSEFDKMRSNLNAELMKDIKFLSIERRNQ